jgi:hypothetical protein
VTWQPHGQGHRTRTSYVASANLDAPFTPRRCASFRPGWPPGRSPPSLRSNGEIPHKPAPPQPRGNRRAGTTELAARAIKLTIVLDGAAVAAIAVPDGGRPRIVVTAAGRRLTAELNPKTLRKTVATIREHGPDQVAVVLQGKLAAGDVIEEGAITAQVKTPKPVPADGAKPLPMETVIQAIERLDTEQAGGEHG